MINTEIAKNKRIILETGSFEQVPFEDHFFDFICLTGIPRPQSGLNTFFKEADRLLRPDGKFCMVILSGRGLITGKACKSIFKNNSADYEQQKCEEAIIYYGMETGFNFLGKTETSINRLIWSEHCLELEREFSYSLFYELSESKFYHSKSNMTAFWFLKSAE